MTTPTRVPPAPTAQTTPAPQSLSVTPVVLPAAERGTDLQVRISAAATEPAGRIEAERSAR